VGFRGGSDLSSKYDRFGWWVGNGLRIVELGIPYSLIGHHLNINLMSMRPTLMCYWELDVWWVLVML
jgi:hypothetical protein